MRQISGRRKCISLQKMLLKYNNLAAITSRRFCQCVRKTAGQAGWNIVARVNGNNDDDNEK